MCEGSPEEIILSSLTSVISEQDSSLPGSACLCCLLFARQAVERG